MQQEDQHAEARGGGKGSAAAQLEEQASTFRKTRRRLLALGQQLWLLPSRTESRLEDLNLPGKIAMCTRIAASTGPEAENWGPYGDLADAIETVELRDIPPGMVARQSPEYRGEGANGNWMGPWAKEGYGTPAAPRKPRDGGGGLRRRGRHASRGQLLPYGDRRVWRAG